MKLRLILIVSPMRHKKHIDGRLMIAIAWKRNVFMIMLLRLLNNQFFCSCNFLILNSNKIYSFGKAIN